MTNITVENHHFYWTNPLFLAIFHSYVKLPEARADSLYHPLPSDKRLHSYGQSTSVIGQSIVNGPFSIAIIAI